VDHRTLGRIGLLALGATALMASACAAPEPARNGARLVAAYVTKVKEEGERFADARELLAKARLRNAGLLEASAVRTEQEIEIDLRMWAIADTKVSAAKEELYGAIRKATERVGEQARELRVLREEQERAIAATRSAVKFRTEKLVESANALGQLAERPAIGDEIQFYADLVRTVAEATKELEQKARGEIASGEQEVARKNDGLTRLLDTIVPTD
jgi:hypothetical protein